MPKMIVLDKVFRNEQLMSKILYPSLTKFGLKYPNSRRETELYSGRKDVITVRAYEGCKAVVGNSVVIEDPITGIVTYDLISFEEILTKQNDSAPYYCQNMVTTKEEYDYVISLVLDKQMLFDSKN